MSEEVIRVENLYKIYGATPRQHPLKMAKQGATKEEILEKTQHVMGVRDVSFSVKSGETFVVMGLSGSGKSTMIRCVNRLIEPTDGKIYLDGEDIAKADRERLREVRRRKITMVFQHFGLFPHKSVAYNVGYGLKVSGVKESEWRPRALEALELVGLGPWADYLPSNLSGGMQQRVGLARALATEATIMLMDEPFSALDPLIRREMQDELMELEARLQKTLLFITHDLGEALRIGSRIAIMRDGEIVQIGTPQEIIAEPADDYVSEFIADVDSSRVLTAEFIMRPVEAINIDKTRQIDQTLRKMENVGRDYLHVINSEGKIQGAVRKQRLLELREKGVNELRKAVNARHLKASTNATLNSLYEMCAEGIPIAIIDENGNLDGIVDPLDVFSALSAPQDEVNVDSGSSNGTSPKEQQPPSEEPEAASETSK